MKAWWMGLGLAAVCSVGVAQQVILDATTFPKADEPSATAPEPEKG